MSSSIEAVKERTEELIQLVDIKSAGRATILPVVKGFGVKELRLELGLFEVGESMHKKYCGNQKSCRVTMSFAHDWKYTAK